MSKLDLRPALFHCDTHCLDMLSCYGKTQVGKSGSSRCRGRSNIRYHTKRHRHDILSGRVGHLVDPESASSFFCCLVVSLHCVFDPEDKSGRHAGPQGQNMCCIRDRRLSGGAVGIHQRTLRTGYSSAEFYNGSFRAEVGLFSWNGIDRTFGGCLYLDKNRYPENSNRVGKRIN